MKRLPFFLSALLLVASLVATLPAVAQISVRSALSDDRDALPGSVYEGVIRVRNDSDVPRQAKIYQTDYFFYADGTNLYGEPGTQPRSNAGWVTFNPPLLTIPPQQTLPVHYTVTVPEGDSLAGTYWSMIMIEGIALDSPESTLPGEATEEVKVGFRQVLRYGIQIATHIPDGREPALAFVGADLVGGDDGSKWLMLDLENEGASLVRPDVWVELFDIDGDQEARVESTPQRIYPGTSVRQRIDLSELDTGAYRALVVVDAGGEDVFAARYTLEL